MCGRFSQKSERKLLAEDFFIDEFTDDVVISYNTAPSQKAGVIINDGKNRYVQFKWGLVPSWAKDQQIGSKLINARAETVASKPSFRKAFRARRCLVPADGFYEWKKSDGYKVPFYIYHKSTRPLGLAGLWDRWKDQEGNILYTFTIITTDATPGLAELHNRMPVIIPPEMRAAWLEAKHESIDELVGFLKPYDDRQLKFHQVSRKVNSPQNNTPDCIKPVSANNLF